MKPTTRTAAPDTLKQRILVLRDFCIRSNGVACERCKLACPVQAIVIDESAEGISALSLPHITENACTQCDICLGVCDAFTSTRVTMIDVRARMKRIALRGEEVIITCQENIFEDLTPAPNVIVLPCLADLSPEFWLSLLADDIAVSIAGDLSYCADCPIAPTTGEALYTRAIETAESWTESRVGYHEEIPEKSSIVSTFASDDEFDRRGIFTNLVSNAADIASGQHRIRHSEVLQNFHEQQERMRARRRLSLNDTPQLNKFAPLGHTKQTMYPKRQLLLEAIDHKPDIASRIPVSLITLDRLLCTNSLACTKVCPTSALYPHPESGNIMFDKRYCIGCGACITACKQTALSLETTTAEALLHSKQESHENASHS